MINITYNTYSILDLITIASLILNLFLSIPVSINKFKSFIRRRSLKILLGNDNITIHIPSRAMIDRIKPVVAMEDYQTFENVRNVLEENKFMVELKYIPVSGDIEINPQNANIVICGPKNSYMVKAIFDNLRGLSFVEEDGKWFFMDEQENKMYSPMDEIPKQNGDIAFLGKVNLDNRLSHSILLICGIHAIGSLGIATFLNNKNLLDSLLKKVKKKKFYSIIYSAHSNDNKDIYTSAIHYDAREINEE
ncbi:hypothetical protein [Neobacillus vireti]|uniref:hypothetical protein n=1 Tax=Neobacillus vireti TaxID=220686 RepID=UPI002FFE0C83